MPREQATASIHAQPLIAGRYQVERLLGEGGMGAVYQVRDEGTGRALALKRLHGTTRGKPRELFEREFRTLASLRHPRIVRVFEYGVDEAGAFYTLELLEGADLSRRAPLPWREVCVCLRDAASLLGVLHSRRLVHRDLSPRNLWQTHHAGLKLLDFGALAAFGPATELVGTPAFVAPEALRGQPLDQRTDLYALGALGYWLLTSTHAFRVSQLAELPQAWTKTPAAPSSLARHVQGADSTIPAELDRLIEALLRLDPDERPRNTAEVIDRLNNIAGLTPEAEDVIVEGYLESGAFVGRAEARERFTAALGQADAGQPVSLRVEGPLGIGRSRMLVELATQARMAGCTVVTADAVTAGRPYETASLLARELLVALPRDAYAAAHTHAATLAGLSPELQQRLGQQAPRAITSSEQADERARRQAALSDWILTVARQHTLMLLVDDLQAADEESQALLASLARSGPGHRLLLVGAIRTDSVLAEQPAVRGFGGERIVLSPLTASELHELLRSVFGEVPYLERTAARVHQLSAGNPAHAWLLLRHLVRRKIARYAEGAWALPTDLPADLPDSLRSSHAAALESLSSDARRMARLASIPSHGGVSRMLLAQLAQLAPSTCEPTIQQLLLQRVLAESSDGLLTTQPALQELLRAELTPHERTRGHRLLAQVLAQQPDLPAVVSAGLHALQAGDFERGEALLMAASRRVMRGDHEGLHNAASVCAEALGLLRQAGRDDYAQLPVLNVLAVAGYQVDWWYALRYGEAAVETLARVLRFDLARRLAPRCGGRLSLAAALGSAWLGMRRRRADLNPIEAVTWLVTVLGYLMGPAAMSVDQERLRRYAKVFEPLLVLGPHHAVATLHRFCLALVLGLEDRCDESQRTLRSVIARLELPGPIPGLPERNRRNLLAAVQYTFGTRETFACDAHVLQTADALSGGTALHALQAEQLRALHHSYLGEVERAADYERRVERKAIQLGTAWQAELVAPRHLVRIALWTHDLAAQKRAVRALTRLVQDIPTFAISLRRARASELVLRGQHREALPLLETEETPQGELGWASMRAQLAYAYNSLGQHERAAAVCRDVLTRMRPGDLDFVILNLPVEIELAVAEAGLGGVARADQRLQGLLQRHASRGPLVVGYLQRARLRISLAHGDVDAADRHLEAMQACYGPTRIPSLLALCVEYQSELQRARHPHASTDATLDRGDAHLLTRVELILGTTANDVSDNTEQAALEVALKVTSAEHACLVYLDPHTAAATSGAPPPSEVVAWARAQLRAAAHEDDRTEAVWSVPPPSHLLDTQRTVGTTHYALALLWQAQPSSEHPIAALILSAATTPPTLPPATILRLLANYVRAPTRASDAPE
ncbi:MAG: serine/threonine-protein kinase [Polyangiales bacterium]